MNRKKFIQSHRATCRNWQWSWSFVNESERFVIFGAWDRFTDGKILSEDWQVRRDGHKSHGYDQSREHVRLIEEEGYRWMTFPMQYEDEGGGLAKIGGFTQSLPRRS